jgi:bis(5'-nucleosyl)-tetraphosphatase (symmetrical)
LHLLALACGVRLPSHSDTLGEVLDAPDAGELIDWLRMRPLVHAEVIAGESFLLVHAGVLPAWSGSAAQSHAAEVEAVLQSDRWRDFILDLYGDEPSIWDEALSGNARLRFIVNSFTRLRFCDAQGVLDLKTKEGAGAAPARFMPWFECPGRQATDTTIVFGHWSTLGLVNEPRLLGLDTGCVWGGALTAVRLENRALVQVACPRYRVPG